MKKYLYLLVGLGLLSQGNAEFNFFKKSEKKPENTKIIQSSSKEKETELASPKRSKFKMPLEKGMTQDQVKKILGEPQNQTLSTRGLMHWRYEKKS